MLLDWYYKLWVDTITKARSKPENKGIWKFYAMTAITFAMAMNLVLIMVIFQEYILKYWFYDIEIHIFSGDKSRINGFIKFFILYGTLPLLINYLLVFRNNRYEILVKKYKYYNGKLFTWYFVISFALPFILLGVAFIYMKITGEL